MRLTPTRGTGFLLSAALLLMGSCDSTTQYHAGSLPPLAPVLVSVDVATRNDTVPCFLICFSNPNTENTTLRLDRAGPAGAAFEQRLRGIPGGLSRLYDEPYPEVADGDFDEYHYRLYAVGSDSMSPASNTDTLYLMAVPPVIDSVITRPAFPVVYYHVRGNRGLSLRIEIIKNDTLLAFKERGETFYGDEYLTDLFDLLSLDTLKARSLSRGDNGTYGVRVLARVSGTPGAVGLAVSKFNVIKP